MYTPGVPWDPLRRYRTNPSTLVGTCWFVGEASSGMNPNYPEFNQEFLQVVAVQKRHAICAQHWFSTQFWITPPVHIPISILLSRHGRYKHVGRLGWLHRYALVTLREAVDTPAIIYRVHEFTFPGIVLEEAYRPDGGPLRERRFLIAWDRFGSSWRKITQAESDLVYQDEVARLEAERAQPADAPVPSGDDRAAAGPDQPTTEPAPEPTSSVWDRLDHG